MSKLTKIRVGGVPEHFNLPWHLAMENGLFEKEGIELEWTVFKGGTGQMTKALRDNEIDVCILLTEGIISDIVKGNPSKLIGKYLNTPLIWGVYTGINNPVNYYGEIYDKNYAISRFGSGSHLMPIVDANAKKIKIKEEQFQVIKNLEGALESLTENETDAFYWEKYTTKPYVDNGTLKHLGDYVTPWPCFMIAATNDIISKEKEAIDNMLKVIYFTSKQFMLSPTSVQEVSDRYNQKLEDVESWFHATEWSVNNDISDKLLKNVLHTLHYAGIIDEKPELGFFKA
ncbi:substrate-binding domain-containing protein [Flavobacteriales bacterium]|jgi:ABC-type nitrate/sulfonate/bicarbonate transport system substrate-binding protein|nr:substrate-binding domain-containing protein [Flavobacteriales bacterium]